jgi:LmbE family N-acetylglucosaminyl deacetylase
VKTRKAMILVAHADDEVLGAGGLIQRLIKADWNVSVVIMSDGQLTVRDVPQDNKTDVYRCCTILGLRSDPILLNYPDQKFDAIPIADMVNAVLKLGFEPDLIVTHVDTDLNLDHRIVCDIAKIVGRPKKRPVAILGCEIPSTTNWNGKQFPANFYVDITNEIETKVEAFSQYRNELQEFPHPWSRHGLQLLAQYHGMQSGFLHAEAFHVIRGIAGLMP